MKPSSGDVFEGPISVTRRGTGFFSIGPDQEDLIIEPENLNGAFPGDIVKVAPAGKLFDPRTKANRPAGKVVEIVSRSRETFVGTLVENKEEGLTMLIPDWKKMYVPFVAKGEMLPIGQKVVIRFKGWAAHQPYPWGEVEEIIGPAGEHETEMRALVLGQGFRPDFPPSVVEEATRLESEGRAMIEEEIAKSVPWGEDHSGYARRDFRNITTFTIDPFDAKDFDDALSVRELPDGKIEVGVHIADVSFFVKPGNALDREAVNRATSIYLVDRTIPMLPHILSTDLCSLNPNEDRLAVSAVFVMDKQAGIIDRWFGETVIHSDKRFTYEEAQEVLDTQDGPLLAELNTIRDLARLMRARREKNGAIAFDTPEVKVLLDPETKKPVDIVLKERRETNLLIEDFMLLANVAVAEHISEITKKNKNLAFIYRVHDTPDADRIEDLAQFLRVLGYTLDTHAGKVEGTTINELLKQVQGKPEEYLVKMSTLRSMAKATYTTHNIGHFGLAFTHYTHFTSPIRRYPDLLVHRMVKCVTAGICPTEDEMARFEELAVHSSEREVRAVEAERDSIKLKQVEYLEPKIGEDFDAVISGVSDRGIFVELTATRAEGMINVRAIGDDYYVYDQKRYRLVGERTKKQYALGDPIRVKLVAARVLERELDFALVEQA